MATGINEPIQATAGNAGDPNAVGHVRVRLSDRAVYVAAVDRAAIVGLDFTASEARALASALDSAAAELERNDLSRCEIKAQSDFPCGGFVETYLPEMIGQDAFTACDEHRSRMIHDQVADAR